MSVVNTKRNRDSIPNKTLSGMRRTAYPSTHRTASMRRAAPSRPFGWGFALCCLLAFLLLIAERTSAAAQTPPISTPDDTLLIRFHPDATDADHTRIIEALDGRLTDWLAPLHIARVETSGAPVDPAAALNAGSLDGAVLFVERDAHVAGTYVPNDPIFNDSGKSYALQAINAPAGWDVTRGSADVLIAILDSGINAQHPEFAGRVQPGYDFVNNDADPADDHGHGTHVAGIAAAAMDNGLGTTGVCPACSLLPVKVLNQENTGTWFDAAQGIVFATDQGADIINLSLGSTEGSETLRAAIQYAQRQGVLIVAAAGNLGVDVPYYPAAYEDVLAVGAVDNGRALWQMSNWGEFIDVVAPGYMIYSTDADLGNAQMGYSLQSGTSMAAPHVAGLAGLLLSQRPERTPADLRQLITQNASEQGAPGWDPHFGYGIIDVGASVRANADDVLYSAEHHQPLQRQVYVPLIVRN